MLNRFVRFCEGMLGRSVSLEGIRERSKVSIVGEIVSPNAVQSMVTPVKTALLDWTVFARHVFHTNAGLDASREQVVLKPLVSGRLGVALVVQTEHGTVSVPLARVKFAPHAPMKRNAQPMSERPPPAIADALDRLPEGAHAGAEFYYGERFLSKGDTISLRAIVEPTGGAGGPYRGSGGATDFCVIDDDEPPRIREIL